MEMTIIYYLQFVIYIIGAFEYSFIDQNELSYLETVLNHSSTNNILESIELTTYFSRLNGLLLYSIDNNYNQLIINLQDTVRPTMKVKFRSESYTITIDDLCKCKIKSCLYEKLIFSFEITNTINIMCNSGSVNKHSFAIKRDINYDYPVPQFNKDIFAYLWLINIPVYTSKHGIAYPNPEYLTGCIKNVTYNGKVIKLNQVGRNRTCETKCQSSLCNEGECLDAFNSQFKCICKDTFLNGEFCNTSLAKPGNWNFAFKFKIIKLSWNFPDKSLERIFILNNSNSSIRVSVNNSTQLLFQFTYSYLTFSIIISEKYNVCDKYIMMIMTKDNNIVVNLKHNNSWKTSDIIINHMLDEVEFHDVTFGVNEEGKPRNDFIGDAVYKLSEDDIEWLSMKSQSILIRKMFVGGDSNYQYPKESIQAKCEKEIPKVLIPDSCKNYSGILIAFGIIDAVAIIIITLLWLISEFKNRRSNLL